MIEYNETNLMQVCIQNLRNGEPTVGELAESFCNLDGDHKARCEA